MLALVCSVRVSFLGTILLTHRHPKKEARMAIEARVTNRKAGDRGGEVYDLINSAGTVRAEVWPQWGFNCVQWQIRQEDGHWADSLFHMPVLESNPVAARSGQPI